MLRGVLRFIGIRPPPAVGLAIDGNRDFEHGLWGKSSEFGNHA
jgi:hypothetical protein